MPFAPNHFTPTFPFPLSQLWAITNPLRRPTFVDLGCGNGFLSHLLRAEGYDGVGYDIRAR